MDARSNFLKEVLFNIDRNELNAVFGKTTPFVENILPKMFHPSPRKKHLIVCYICSINNVLTNLPKKLTELVPSGLLF